MVRERALNDGVEVDLAESPGVDVVDRRRASDQAGDLQPALERGEVHARRRSGRRERGTGQRRGAGLRHRHRPRHRRGGPRADLRGVPADGRGSRARRGNRPRPRAVEATRRAARRPDLGRQRASAREARSCSRSPRSGRDHGRSADPRRRGQREEHEAVLRRPPARRGTARSRRRRANRRSSSRSSSNRISC